MAGAFQTDDDLIAYAALHCKTERALFHRDHLNRLLSLAGREPVDGKEWFALHRDEMEPILADIERKRAAA